MRRERFDNLRVADISTFLAVRRCASVSAAARELKVTPSQVSKAIDRLSGDLGRQLLSRTGRGVRLTDEGRRLAPHLEELVARLRLVARGDVQPAPEITVAAPSFLASIFLGRVAAAIPTLRIRGLELPPASIRAYATERLFDAAMSLGPERLPDVWVTRSVGEIRKGLFASPALAKRMRPFPATVERLRDVPFVTPVYSTNGHLVPADDECPLPRGERRLGHEAVTIGLALELAARTDQLVFGPVIASRWFVERGLLEEVPVRGWTVSEPLHIACHGDRVLATVQGAIVRALATALAEMSTPAPRG